MTTFKEIRGTTIEVVSSDPANPEAGQIWYNSSSGTLKGYLLANVNAWASGGNLPAARSNAGLTGTQNASIIAFGQSGSPPTYSNNALTYNGTSWTSITNGSVARTFPGNLGTQTAALFFGGEIPGGVTGSTEKWNGTSWTTNPTGLNQARRGMGNSGTDTAGLAYGGDNDAGTVYANTESWNGTSWTATTAMNTARLGMGSSGDGSQTAALGFGGTPLSGYTAATESWNGSSWTTVNSLSTARAYGVSFGTQTASVFGDGFNGSNVSQTELWNGTSWSTNPSTLSTTRRVVPGAGSQTAGIAAGGASPTGADLTATEEWTGQALLVKTITVS
jgi:hypothetical protein